MALEIQWTTRADIKLDHLIIYLESEWGESVVKAFMKKFMIFWKYYQNSQRLDLCSTLKKRYGVSH